jgi:hypothetical protein
MIKNEPILKIKKRKSKLENAWSNAANRSSNRFVAEKLFGFKELKGLLPHPVVSLQLTACVVNDVAFIRRFIAVFWAVINIRSQYSHQLQLLNLHMKY